MEHRLPWELSYSFAAAPHAATVVTPLCSPPRTSFQRSHIPTGPSCDPCLLQGRGIGQTPRSSPQPEPRSSGQQAQHGQVLVYEGKQYIPLAEVHRFYEAGVRSGAVERIEMLEAQLQSEPPWPHLIPLCSSPAPPTRAVRICRNVLQCWPRFWVCRVTGRAR